MHCECLECGRTRLLRYFNGTTRICDDCRPIVRERRKQKAKLTRVFKQKQLPLFSNTTP